MDAVGLSDPPKLPLLSYRTVGEVSWIDEPAAAKIHDVVALRLGPGVTPEGLRAALHHAVLETMMLAFGRDPRGRRQDIERLHDHFRGYQDLARSLAGDDLFPPKMPSQWAASVERWFDDMEVWLKEPSPGGRPRSLLGTHLLPRLLGIFFAVYGRRPTVSAARHTATDGAAARLILSVIEEVQAVQDRLGFDEVIYDEDHRARLRWRIPTSSALEQMIRRALQRRNDRSHEIAGGPTSPDFVWEVWANYFATLFFRT